MPLIGIQSHWASSEYRCSESIWNKSAAFMSFFATPGEATGRTVTSLRGKNSNRGKATCVELFDETHVDPAPLGGWVFPEIVNR